MSRMSAFFRGALLVILVHLVPCLAIGDDAAKGLPVEDNTSEVAPTEVFEAIQQQLMDFDKSQGRRPTVDDFHRILKDQDDNYRVGMRQRMDLWELYRKTQDAPLLSLADLSMLSKSTRESIWSCRTLCRHRIYTYVDGRRSLSSDTHVECVRHDGNVLMRTTGKDREQTKSYDGKYMRAFDTVGTARQGSIQTLPSREILWQLIDSDILMLSMLCDTQTETGMKMMTYDLPLFLEAKYIVVFAAITQIEGRSILRVGEPSVQVWCDVDKNCAVTKLNVNSCSKDGRRDVKVVRRTLSGHEEQDDGIWLPRKIVLERFNDDQENTIASENIIEYLEVEVNKPFASELFSDIIPDGVPVVDGTRNVMYVSGSPTTSIDEAVRRSASRVYNPPSSNVSLRRSLIIANALVASAFVVYWLVRRGWKVLK